ncbi:hypothetical protein FLONG3_8488 [Fusarium longipes]|uniref:NACHT domain-containing protein n=1 Tax=Fusarium longipes TaxID=694270 RepID=A0A395S5F4_9HYPO|nr:hypothetical protein FLONG3_8488 [Fusarium longipes]
MSGLEALGIASSILQVISFALETARLCKAVYNDEPTTNDEIEEQSVLLKEASELTFDVCRAYQPHTNDEKKLKGIAAQCNKTATELEDKLSDVMRHNSPGSTSKAVAVLLKTWKNKKNIERLEKRLDRYKNVMETHLLVAIFKRSDAMALQQKQEFQNLSQSLQSFITQYAAGETQIRTLIRAENVVLRHYTKQTILQTEVAVKDRITDAMNGISLQQKSEAERSQLLQSLHYREMNSRRNQIHLSYNNTFRWIFETSSISSDKDKTISPEGDKSFVTWLTSDGQIYWISGKPGSGKSTLMKFLAGHPKSISLLSDSTPGSLGKVKIISHFFWKVGGGIMNSLKGMWLSLTYQVLSTAPEMSDHILDAFPSSTRKRFDSDWSTPEICEVFLNIISRYPAKICIFLDGLDEVSADDVDERRKVVHDLCQFQHIKICIASRPEWRLEMWLHEYPFIRLQDWTRRDRREYACGDLQPFVERNLLSVGLQMQLASILVDKSMGVFLWMYVALRTVKLGLDNGDKPHDLFQRVQALPNEMEALYQDLWETLSRDSPNYRQKAARFLRLTLEFGDRPDFGEFSILELAVMQSPHLQEMLLEMSSDVHYSDFGSHCTKVVRDIRIQCLGLVETYSFTDRTATLHSPEKFQNLDKSENTSLRFMHRTVYDFLTETVAGQELLKHDTLSRTDLFVLRVKNMLASAVLRKSSQNPSLAYPCELGYAFSILNEVYHDAPLSDDLSELLKLLESWYVHRLAAFHNAFYTLNQFRHATFLAGCVYYSSGFHDPFILWVKQQIGYNEDLATEVFENSCGRIMYVMYESRQHYQILKMADESISIRLIEDWFLQIELNEDPRWLPHPGTLLSAISSQLSKDNIFERVTEDVIDANYGRIYGKEDGYWISESDDD